MLCPGFSAESYDLFSLGVLEPDEAEQLEEHRRTHCGTCEQAIRESRERMALFALAVPAVKPPARLRGRILASVKPERREATSWSAFPGLAWAMALAIAFLGGSAVWVLSHGNTASRLPGVSRTTPPPPPVVVPAPARDVPPETVPANTESSRAAELTRLLASKQQAVTQLDADLAKQRSRTQQVESDLRAKETQLVAAQRDLAAARIQRAANQGAGENGARVQELETQLASSRQKVDELTRQVQFYRTAVENEQRSTQRNVQLIALLRSPALRVLDLRATEQGGAASARALLAEPGQLLVYVSNLPALPAGRTYQLWLMRNQGRAVTSGGIFQPDRGQSAFLTVPNPGDLKSVTALAITEEPAAGQPLPTGPKILFGALRA